MGTPGRIVTVLDQRGAQGGSGLEMIAVARQLARALGGYVTALILSPTERTDGKLAIDLGADELFIACAPWLAEYQADAYIAALSEACQELEPEVLLLPHDSAAWEVAPRLAARLDGGIVTDCVSLRVDASSRALIGVRPCFSGKALSEWAVTGDGPKIATLRRQSTPPGELVAGRDGHISTIHLSGDPRLRAKVIDRVVPPAGQIRLEDAEVVIGVGRGVGTKEAFQDCFVNGLARTLGAVCGGSRGAVDLGIVPTELQIGLTGRVVSPKLYIAVGLSGSPQHMAGCSGARTIVAINTDPQAPIFGFAHYGVVGDYRRVVPSLTRRLQQVLAATAEQMEISRSGDGA